MAISFKLKLFISFVLYGILLVAFTQFVVFKINEASIKKDSIKGAQKQFEISNNFFKNYIKNTNLILSSIKTSEIFKQNFDPSKKSSLIDSLFLDMAKTSNNIMQLRYLDNKGVEKIRVDRKNFASTPYLIEKDKLQDKGNRYYFKKTITLNDGDFWYSKLDLNIEQGKIEKPIKPVLRIATPLFYKGRKIGILIINIFMKEFLKEFSSVANYNLYLVDKDGFIILHPNEKNCWCRYLKNGHKDTLSTYFPNTAKEILNNDKYFGESFFSKKIFLNNSENIKMIIEPKQSYIQKEIYNNTYNLLLVLFGVIIISFPISYFLSIIPSRLKAEVDKKTSEQKVLLSLFDLSDTVLFKWKNDKHRSLEYVSKSVIKLLGYSQDDFQNGNIRYSSLIHHDDAKRVTTEVMDAIENNLYFFEHEPYRIITKDGNIKWILDSTVIIRDTNNNVTNFLGYLIDITDLKNTEIKLKNLSVTDTLTKIYNRMYIDENLQKQFYRFNRNNENCSIIMIDIDYFKSVNDIHGHLAGDIVLIEFASLISSSLRASDILGRWGGEEFLIILPHTDLQTAVQIANKLRKQIENNNFSIVGKKTASFGVASFEKDISVEITIDRADKALYHSKKHGKNLVSSTQEL